MEKATKFAEKMKKMQEKARAVFKNTQEKMKQQADRERKKRQEWKKGDKLMLNTKDLVFKE